MNRYMRDNRPRVRPVDKIELDERNTKRRVILAALFACIGIVALVYGFMKLIGGAEPGWDTIEAASSSYQTCAGDFVFQYELGAEGRSASSEKKELQGLYTEAAEKAYRMFCSDELPQGEEEHNIWYINRHPGEEIKVEEALYHAFEQMEDSGCRLQYLGPVYNLYDDMFYCQDDSQAMEYDPYEDEGAAVLYRRFAEYAADPGAVNLALLGDSTVRLEVSEEYRAFAEEEGTQTYIDFFWMKNAFIIDYLAETLMEQGYTRGILSSFDGCSRSLTGVDAGDKSDVKLSFNIYDYQESERLIYPAAVMEYEGAASIVSLRDYKRNELDQRYCYEYQDGTTRTSYLSLEDGRCRSSLHDLTVCSREVGCAGLLLSAVPIYLAEEFESGVVGRLAAEKVYAVYCEDRTIFYSDPDVLLKDIFKKGGVVYERERIYGSTGPDIDGVN